MAAAKKEVEIDELEGINELECPILCEQGRCVITADSHCGHPRKGGIQSVHQSRPEVIRRYNRARMMLAQVKDKARMDIE